MTSSWRKPRSRGSSSEGAAPARRSPRRTPPASTSVRMSRAICRAGVGTGPSAETRAGRKARSRREGRRVHGAPALGLDLENGEARAPSARHQEGAFVLTEDQAGLAGAVWGLGGGEDLEAAALEGRPRAGPRVKPPDAPGDVKGALGPVDPAVLLSDDRSEGGSAGVLGDGNEIPHLEARQGLEEHVRTEE